MPFLNDIDPSTPVDATAKVLGVQGGKSHLFPFSFTGAGAVARTFSDKLNEHVTFEDFGTTGTSDDTVVLQKALSSTAPYIFGTPGKTYTVDGTLSTTLAGRIIDLSGCTVILKSSAATRICLMISGSGTQVIGGTFDAAKATNSGTLIAQKYATACIKVLAANDVQIRRVALNNSFGMGVWGTGGINRLLVDSCTSSGCELYGVFVDSNNATDQTGNQVIGCTFDMTGNTTPSISGAGGVLLTSLYADSTDSGFAQINWAMKWNRVTMLASLVSSGVTSSSGLSVRGYTGEYHGNYVSGGSLGITEGSRATRYTNNYCVSQYYTGIEVFGDDALVSDNVITDATQYGVSAATSAGKAQKNLTIVGNIMRDCAGSSIYINPSVGGVLSNLLISGNVLYCSNGGAQRGMTLSTRKYLGCSITDNNLFGVTGGRAIVFENATTDSSAFVCGNMFEDWTTPLTLFHAAGTVVNDFVAVENTMKVCGAGSNSWVASTGATTFGINVIYRRNNYNQGVLNVFEQVMLRGTPNAQTTSATLLYSHLLTGIIQGTHSAGSTQTYTLPTGTLMDSGITMNNQIACGFEWSLINLSSGAANTITIAGDTGHTLVGSALVAAGDSARWLTKKTAAATYITYRIA